MAWDDLHDHKTPDERFKGPTGGGGGPGGRPPFDLPQIKFPQFKPSMFVLVILILLVVWILPSVFYFVEPDEEGVVTRFGKYVHSTPPGIHFKFPSPVEHVETPKVRKVQRAEIGFRVLEGGPSQRVPAESLMLTGDQNIVDINLVVQYRISDAVAYLFNVRQPHRLMRNAAETIIRGIVGSKKIDEALTTGKAEIQVLAQEKIQALMDRYQSGIQVITVQLQDVHPPEQVAGAFKDVVSAREDKERMINEAQGYRNAVIPEARGQAAQIVREAEAYREQTVKRAQGDANRFLAQWEEYKKAPEITRKRIYLETMEEILPHLHKFVMSSKNPGVVPLLPLGSMQLPVESGSKR
ncbi:MAG: FtsH protease activity modulator HflK [Nitrospinae bacterium CG11_big_fil_rev_8_21_14_0_20_56_8]|nr:MAG: FtsH protease activity modulator HflK [Nitrospinae bacterium CG11_big_fil_rev_8_21_14_0_20_56_8]